MHSMSRLKRMRCALYSFNGDTDATFAEKSLYFRGGHNPYRYKIRVQNHIRVTVRSEKREKERITARYSFRSLLVAG